MDLLRRKQVAEVLDEDRRINDRVFNREKTQVKEFDEVVKPKTGRDIDTEVKFDKEIEKMNSVLSYKLSALENIFKPYGKSVDVMAKNQEVIFNSSDVITTFNDLARAINAPTLANDTKEALKAKVQEIATNVNALVYGYRQLLEQVNSRGGETAEATKARLIPRLITASSAVSTIQKQLFSSSYTPITSSELQTTYAKIVAALPERLRTFVKGLDSARDLSRRPLQAGLERDVLQRRIRMLEADRGQPLSVEEIARVRNTLFGATESRADPDPAVAEELHRQDQQELEDRTAANSVVQGLPEPIIPAPRYSNLGEELRRSIIEEGDRSYEEDVVRIQGILRSYIDKYRRQQADVIPEDVIRGEVSGLLRPLQATIIENASANGEELDEADVVASIQDRYGDLLIANPRSNAARRNAFARAIVALVNEFIDRYSIQLRRKADERVQQGLNVPVIGEGKPHHGLQYEEEKQENIPAPHSRIHDEDRPDPSFFKRNHTKGHRRF